VAKADRNAPTGVGFRAWVAGSGPRRRGPFRARFVAATARKGMVDGWGLLGFWRFVIGEW